MTGHPLSRKSRNETPRLSAENLRDAARIIRAYEGEATYPAALANHLEACAAELTAWEAAA